MNKIIKKFAVECVEHYAEFNDVDVFYNLDATDLPDFVQHEFAALLITHEEAYASEATGADNPCWETKMRPALTRYLANSTAKDEAIEFNRVWREGVTSYLIPVMRELIDDALSDFNSDHGYSTPANHHYGVALHG